MSWNYKIVSHAISPTHSCNEILDSNKNKVQFLNRRKRQPSESVSMPGIKLGP